MNLKVNKEKCIGCGRCVGICESVFTFTEDEEGNYKAEVIESPVAEENKENADIAKESCPTGAIEEE